MLEEAALNKKDQSKVIVLASGGIDSTALIDFYIRRKNRVECMHFQYGQANAKSEKEAFKNITKFYGVKGTIVDMGFSMNKRKDEILGRNVLFALITGFTSKNASRIAIGIHAGTQYYDCTRAFVNDCQKILDGYFPGTVRLEAPFLNLFKSEILRYCNEFGVPINMTYSCQRQNFPACGECPSCIERRFQGDVSYGT